jgi:hypothetical protein
LPSFREVPPSGFYLLSGVNFRFKYADIRQVTINLGIVKTITYQELIRNRETAVVDVHINQTARRLRQQGAELYRLGFALLERWSGGASGGGARLTSEGRRFLDAYKALSVKVQQSAEALFATCFALTEGADKSSAEGYGGQE